jgi:Cutinase/Fibronectin type III domain
MRSRSRLRVLAVVAVTTAGILAMLGMPATAFARSTGMSVSPSSGPPGQQVTLKGEGFAAYAGSGIEIDISIDHGNGNWDLLVRGAANPVPDVNGNFTVNVTIPANAPPGDLLAISTVTEPEADAFFTVTRPSGTGTSAPAAPSGLTVTAAGPHDIKLNWRDNSGNETGFEISNGVVSRNVGANSTAYTWSGLAPGTYMCFRVRAHNSAGNSAWEPGVSPWYRCTTTPKGTPAPKSCPTVLLGLHGMGEGPSSTMRPDISNEVESTFVFFKAIAANAHKFSPGDYQVQDVSYPTTGFAELDNPILMRTIVSDVVVGAKALDTAVQHYTSLCRTSHFELVGYSEGAWVIDYWLHFHPQARNLVKAVQLYGDPNYYEIYQRDRHGVHAYRGLSRLAHLTFGWYGPPYPDPNAGYPVKTACIAKDPVCGKGYMDSFTAHSRQFGAAAFCKITNCNHLDYVVDGYTKRGAAFLARYAF